MNLEEIKEHWNRAGSDIILNSEISPTSRDPYLGLLERRNIMDFIQKDMKALEIGCGDGMHSVYYAANLLSLTGIDISDALVKRARDFAKEQQVDNIRFISGSVLNLNELLSGEKYDCIISQRCLINLPDWEYQREALTQITELIKSGGYLLITEGFNDGLENLNEVRIAYGLPEINTVEYNHNFYRRQFEEFIKRLFDIVEIRHYGSYLLLSRVFHPLVVAPEFPKHNARLNEVAMNISTVMNSDDFEIYSYNLFYVLRKK